MQVATQCGQEQFGAVLPPNDINDEHAVGFAMDDADAVDQAIAGVHCLFPLGATLAAMARACATLMYRRVPSGSSSVPPVAVGPAKLAR
jgi:hypothetical protein